jgi:hypothetical protein
VARGRKAERPHTSMEYQEEIHMTFNLLAFEMVEENKTGSFKKMIQKVYTRR